MEVTIDNRCSNIELTSPVYFIKNATYHGHLSQQVDSKSRIKVNFITGIDEDTFGGALLYRLQRKYNNEPDHQFDADKDIFISAQLLVFWRCERARFYSLATLIEHDITFIWNENKLEEFYHIHDRRYNIKPAFDQFIRSLNDGTTLKVKCRLLHGGLKMNIITSEEEKQSLPERPWWIDSNR
jgi:hypothetical protein